MTLLKRLVLLALGLFFIWLFTTTLSLLNMPNTAAVAFGAICLITEVGIAIELAMRLVREQKATKVSAPKGDQE